MKKHIENLIAEFEKQRSLAEEARANSISERMVQYYAGKMDAIDLCLKECKKLISK